MSDINQALALILRNQRTIMIAMSTSPQFGTFRSELVKEYTDTGAALQHPFFCDHDWEDGYSMNGPTKTCRKCRKFMRD